MQMLVTIGTLFKARTHGFKNKKDAATHVNIYRWQLFLLVMQVLTEVSPITKSVE